MVAKVAESGELDTQNSLRHKQHIVRRNRLVHEIRNAMAGIQLERRNIARSLVSMQDYMQRIENALSEDARE